jgi:uncharacterized membrane protein
MAGIGFELQRALKKGGIGTFLKVALTGIIIVAGPWLLSMLAIFLISRFLGYALEENRRLFLSVIVYSYAFSLFLFGGSHYIFTRYISDLIYLEKNREAGASLIIFTVLILAASSLVALAAVWFIPAELLSRPLLFKLSAWLFFATVNVLWILMVFVSLLRRYVAVFVVYLGGIVASIVGVSLLGRLYALAGAMLGFAAGQLMTVILLAVLALKEYPPGRLAPALRDLIRYFPKYGSLLLSGTFYYWAIWIDKIVFWFGHGEPVEGTFFRLFDFYDIPVYLTNLTMIPGLVYFIVVFETGFYLLLKDFLQSLGTGTHRTIQERKYALIRGIASGLREQVLFQGLLVLVIGLLASRLSASLFDGSLAVTTFRVSLAAVFFHFMYLTLMTFLFYFELYRQSAFCSFLYFAVNTAGSLAIVYWGSAEMAGYSYLAAGIFATLTAGSLLFTSARRIDRTILIRYSAG